MSKPETDKAMAAARAAASYLYGISSERSDGEYIRLSRRLNDAEIAAMAEAIRKAVQP